MKEMEMLLKTVSDGLKILAQGVRIIAERLDNFSDQNRDNFSETEAETVPVRKVRVKPSAKRAPRKAAGASKPKEKAPKPSADKVYETMKRIGGPVELDRLAEKTGLNKKQVHNAIFKLKKQGRVENVSKGVYKTVA
jgi:predicted Rossmann fold nucleotide-binding protein DprA/Smf involved in DNA uptake